jgi:hypothetical protein
MVIVLRVFDENLCRAVAVTVPLSAATDATTELLRDAQRTRGKDAACTA